MVDDKEFYLPPGVSRNITIKPYYINYQRNDGKEINMRIYETPGIGDTIRNLADNLIIKRILNLLQEVNEIDYFLFTVKSLTTRWTHSSQYIYERIQEIFGKDIKDRFILMCTFSDYFKPTIINTLEGKIDFEHYFCFNNYALFIQPESSDNTKLFWKLGMNSFENFLI